MKDHPIGQAISYAISQLSPADPIENHVLRAVSVLGMALEVSHDEGVRAMRAVLKCVNDAGCPCRRHDSAVHVIDLECSSRALRVVGVCKAGAETTKPVCDAHGLILKCADSIFNYLGIAILHDNMDALATLNKGLDSAGWPLAAACMRECAVVEDAASVLN